MSQYNVNVAKSRLSVGFVKNDEVFLNLWENQQTFKKVNQKLTGKPFVLLDGPPYANGDAHLGHALNKLFKDLVVKSQWFNGRSVDYRPGWDCHGLPLELAVEKKYGKLDTDTLKTRCKQLAFRSLVKQRKSFKKLGVLGQWDKPYVTLSQDMVKDSWKTVKKLLEKDLLEYKRYPVHYCPACASSLAEAELENKVLNKDSLFFKMQLKGHTQYDNLFAVVWTTTPWTLPMNQGLAYHNNFEYVLYQKNDTYLVTQKVEEVEHYLSQEGFVEVSHVSGEFLNNLVAVSPVTKLEVPVLHADFVETGKTGFVHLAFSHGPEDFELGQAHNLQPVSYLNKYGVFDNNVESLNFLNGKKYTQVQSLVCDKLNDEGNLVSYSNQQVEQQVCWRHKCGVYYNATYQGFVTLDAPHYNLKNKVQALLEKSHLQSSQKERLSQMLLNRKNWCLSRQRKWGCPMNLLVHKDTHALNVNLSLQYLDLCMEGTTLLQEDFLNNHSDYYLFDDVLDVWFDSGNVANNYANNHDCSEDYMVDLVLEGKDQFRGWFQSLLWLSVAANEKMPYKNLFCHGFVLDENRNKFSKSSGNGSPVEHYLNMFGADVLHLWVASQEPELDAVFSDKKLEEMKKYYSRFRLCLRFLTSNLYDYDVNNHKQLLETVQHSNEWDLHRHLLKDMAQLKDNLSQYFNQYQFKKGVEALYHFCDKTLSNFYFDWVKNPMYLLNQQSNLRALHQAGMFEVLMATFDMVKVFAPFVAEEFYQDFFNNTANSTNFNNSSVLENYYFTEEKTTWVNQLTVFADWNKVQEARKLTQATLEPLQKDKTVKSRTEVGVELYVPEQDYATFEFVNANFKLSELLSVSFANLHKQDNQEKLSVDMLVLNNREDYKKCPRCWNYEHTSHFHGELCHYCDEEN